MTLPQIARLLNIPVSTVRYYKDRFSQFMPEWGEGRTKKYTPETIEVIKIISESMKDNLSDRQIQELLLSKGFEPIYEAEGGEKEELEPAQSTNFFIPHEDIVSLFEHYFGQQTEVIKQQHDLLQKQGESEEKMIQLLEVVVEQQQTIIDLNKQVQVQQEQLNNQQHSIQEVQQSQIEAQKKKSFLAKLFG